MDISEYRNGVEEAENEAKVKKYNLARKYALANSTVRDGDIVEDHIGKVLVDRIRVAYTLGGDPCCVYYGLELKKDGKPRKDGKRRGAFQTNLKLYTRKK